MSCVNTTTNPMGNFLPFDDRKREPACRDNIKPTIHFYTMPVTTSAPDSVGFAHYLFPNSARCRETGYLCQTNADTTYNLDRLAYYPGDAYYQKINNPTSKQLGQDKEADIAFR
jgi:hypothetical protein